MAIGDMYAQQIAQARNANLPVIQKGPAFLPIQTQSGGSQVGDAISAAMPLVMKAFVEPRMQARVNQYMMENDPATLEKNMLAALEWQSKIPDEDYEKVRTSAGHQQRLQNFVQKVPGATDYITRHPDNTLSFIRREKTKDEREAKEVPSNAQSTRALQGAQTTQLGAETKKTLIGDLPYIQAQTGLVGAQTGLVGAQTTQVGQEIEESKARSKKLDAETKALTIVEPWIIPGIKAEIGLKNAQAYNAVQQGGYYSRMPDTQAQAGLEAYKAKIQETKDVIKGHEMQKKQIDHDTYVQFGDNPSLDKQAIGLRRHAQDAIGIAYKLGSNNDYARGEAAESIDSLYGGFVAANATKHPTKLGRQWFGYEASMKKSMGLMRELSSYAAQQYDIFGPYLPKDALQKVMYMDYLMKVKSGELKSVGWTSPSQIPDQVLMANLCKKFGITDPATINGIAQSWTNIQAYPNPGTTVERNRATVGGN